MKNAKNKRTLLFRVFTILCFLCGSIHWVAAQSSDHQWWTPSGPPGSVIITGNCSQGFNTNPPVDWPAGAPQHSIWDVSPGIIVRSFKIKADKSLTIRTNCQFWADGAGGTDFVHIIVEKGGKLILDGTTLTRCGSSWFWGGIIVEGDAALSQTLTNQGTVEITNSTIEYAHTALDLSTGGMVQAATADFENFGQAAVFGPASYLSASYFDGCNFVVDDTYPTRTTSSGACHPNSPLLHEEAMVLIDRHHGIEFYGCSFANQNSTQAIEKVEHAGGGISLTDASIRLIATPWLPPGTGYEGNCHIGAVGNGEGCEFSRLAFGIRSERTSAELGEVYLELLGKQSSSNPQAAGNYHHRFTDCLAGVVAINVEQVKISGNVFLTRDDHQLATAPQAWCTPFSTEQESNNQSIAVSLEGCPRHIVSNNLFDYNQPEVEHYTAVLIKNSGDIRAVDDPAITYNGNWQANYLQAFVRNNQFSFAAENHGAGCLYQVYGLHLVGENPHEVLICNEFSLPDYAAQANCPAFFDIAIDNGKLPGTLVDFPAEIGTATEAADNVFTAYKNPNYNVWYNDPLGGGTVNYYMRSACYYYEPVKAQNVLPLLAPQRNCVFTDYCLNPAPINAFIVPDPDKKGP